VLVFGHRWHQAGVGAAALGVSCAALSLDSIASDAWKAHGRPDMLPRMHGLSLLLTAIGVAAGVPFGLIGVAIGISVSAVGVAAYAVWGMSTALGIELADLLREIWPPAVAAGAMAGALFLLEHFVVHADRHAVAPGLALLIGEGLLGLAVYLALLTLVAPRSVTELLGAVRRRLA
jgi:O-antigen/teichoic acid export membrane protein